MLSGLIKMEVGTREILTCRYALSWCNSIMIYYYNLLLTVIVSILKIGKQLAWLINFGTRKGLSLIVEKKVCLQ